MSMPPLSSTTLTWSRDSLNLTQVAPDLKLVLDANVFFNRTSFYRYGRQFYTVPEVIREIKDDQTKLYYETLPVTVQLREPSPEAVAFVTQFSKLTGDFPTLSKVDIKVIALAYTLEKEEKGGVDHLRTVPPEIAYEAEDDQSESSGDEGTQEDGPGEEDSEEDGWEVARSDSGSDSEGFDEEAWITPDNIQEYTK